MSAIEGQWAQALVEGACRQGAEGAEVFYSRVQELTVEVGNGILENLKSAQEQGVGIRVFWRQRMGFAFTSDLSEQSLDNAVQQALANARKTAADDYYRLPDPVEYPQLDLGGNGLTTIPLEEKIDWAMTMDRAARQQNPMVKLTERNVYQEARYQVALVNSQGINNGFCGSYCGLYSLAVAENGGNSETGFEVQYTLDPCQLDPVQVGQQAADKAVRMLGARGIETRTTVVVLDPFVAANFLGILAPALTGEAVQKGKSLFAGLVGQPVISPMCTVVDDGARPGWVSSTPFDGEGVPCQKTVIIQQGSLQQLLHNTYTAAKEGTESTGNGLRHSFRSTLEVGSTGFYLEPGTISSDQLLAEVDAGLYVTEVMGLHTANPISGDFSVGVAGLWIDKGRLAFPVRGVALAGNLQTMFQEVDAVGDDLRYFISRGAPTVRIKQLTISGS